MDEKVHRIRVGVVGQGRRSYLGEEFLHCGGDLGGNARSQLLHRLGQIHIWPIETAAQLLQGIGASVIGDRLVLGRLERLETLFGGDVIALTERRQHEAFPHPPATGIDHPIGKLLLNRLEVVNNGAGVAMLVGLLHKCPEGH